MDVHIDISLFSSSAGSFGVINGTLAMDIIPRIGDSISFGFPKNEGVLPLGVTWFVGILKVTDVLHTPKDNGTQVSVCLESVVLDSKDKCKTLSTYFEKGFGLYTDEH
jgi:hypothetical protein